MFGTIVVGTDASPASRAAVALAIDLAKANAADVVFVNVVDAAKLMPLSGYENPYPEEAVDMLLDESTKLLDGAVAQAEATGIKASVRSSQGDAADEILDAAEQSKAGLIVLGTHGRTGLARLFVGSVADAVLRRAVCPVLVTK
jgi:nucleotide-binding universal stress UspA family protein